MPPQTPAPHNPNEVPDRILPRPAVASGEGGPHPSTQPMSSSPMGSPSGQKPSAGPVVGIVIIVVLMIVGALYFWGARLNHQNNQDQLPFIPPENSTTTIH